jgi:cation diffusion facilitator family transporter
MTDLLVKLFVKNSDDVLNPAVREKYGILSGAVGIACNLLLCAIKFFAGMLTGAISIMADALNNLSDAGSSIVTMLGFKLACRPADSEHPYGHGRYEYLTALVIAAAILLMGVELLKSSVDKIIHPENVEFSVVSVVILVASIAVKLWMNLFNRKLGSRIDAQAMLATAADSLNDCIATAAVLAALLIGHFANINIDGFAGVFVALFVLWAGFSGARDTIEPLLGQAPDPAFVKALQTEIAKYEEIMGIHDLNVHDYGPGRVFVSLHAEIPSDMDIMTAHDVIDKAEYEIGKGLNCEISIHMDPIAVNDEKTVKLRKMVTDIAKGLDERLTIHDFRITDGPLRTNLIFDVVLPFDLKMSDREAVEYISQKIKAVDEKYFAVIQVDKM